MAERDEDDEVSIGHSSTTIRGGEKELSQGGSGDPGRTPGSAEGDRETVEEDLRDKQGGA